MLFYYKAKDGKNQSSQGVIESVDYNSAVMSLKQKGLTIKSISDKKALTLALFNSVPLKEKIVFTKQLALMMRSGLSIVDALQSISEETGNKYLKEVSDTISKDLQGGKNLSQSLLKHPKVFNKIFVNMVASGEKSGKLEDVLERLALQLDKDYELNRKIRGALAYPAIVLIVLVAVMIIILTFIIPGLTEVFTSSGVEMPKITQIIVGMSDFLIKNGLLSFLIAIFIIGGIYLWQLTETGKLYMAKLIIKIPVLGGLLAKSYISRFTRTFAALFSSGLPLLDVIKSSGEVMVNIVYVRESEKIADKVKTGTSLSAALKSSKMFPKMVGQMAVVGEKSGNLDTVFDNLADFYDREIDGITSNISTLLEPILIVIMGIGISFIILSVLQPIYGLVNAI